MQILVIDHFILRREALVSTLQNINSDFQPSQTADPLQFARENPKISPRIIFLVALAQTAGISEIQTSSRITMLKELYPGSSIVVCGSGPETNIKKYLSIGIDGYLSRSASTDDLQKCVEMILQGKKFVEASILISLLHVQSSVGYAVSDHQIASLSPIERRVARLIIRGKSQKDIADMVHRHLGTIDNIRKRILGKLNIDSTYALKKLANRF